LTQQAGFLFQNSWFALNEDKIRIRANQGHSIEVDLGYHAQTPPAVLYHGTAGRFVDSIKKRGLIKGQQHHVHLTTNADTACNVGSRYGEPVLISVDAGAMHALNYLVLMVIYILSGKGNRGKFDLQLFNLLLANTRTVFKSYHLDFATSAQLLKALNSDFGFIQTNSP
jgi:hypothetical protein